MLAGTHRHALQVEQGGQVVRMRTFDLERHHRGLVRGGAEDAHAVHALQFLGEVRQQFLLARGDVLAAECIQVVHGRAEADEAGDVRRAGLELVRGIVEHGAVEADFLDHLAAAEERRHRLQMLAPRPQRAGAGRAAHLVAGDRIEITADGGHVHAQVRRGLRAIDHAGDAALARFAADLAHRVDGAQHVGHMRHRQQLHVRGHRRVQRIQVEAAVGQDLGHADGCPGALRDQLPRHDVGVVLHARDQDHVAGLQARQGPRIGHQVDREGGAAAQHQFVGTHVEEARQGAARAFVGVGGLAAQRMHRTADIGVVTPVEGVHRIDHRQRLLRGVGVVEIHQRLAVDFAHQHREVGAHALPVGGSAGGRERRRRGQVHAMPACCSAWSRCRASAAVSASPSAASGSWQNAALSMARACSAGTPRERR